MIDYPLNVSVVRSGDRTILIDSGLGTEFPGFPRAGQLAVRLDAAGIDPASVTDVVLTHLHMDHIGGLLVEGLRGRLRKDLRVHLAAAEAEFWQAPDFSRTAMPAPVPETLVTTAARFLDVYRGQLRPFETEFEVAPGVLIERTGGHTPGHSIVRLESGGERLTFAGDAVFQCGFDQPGWYNGFEHDPEESARVRMRLLKEMAASGAHLMASHLPRAWDRYLDYRDGQARKLLTRFGPDLLGFDCAWERSAANWRMPEPTRTIRDLAPDAVCNFRLLGHGDYATLEQGLPVSAPAVALGVVPHRAYY
ncbi:MBL fold metallo-hydrolase [Streptomyces sp. NPDC058783]|uniref:MBL fold metallo-hydrolase n=1 Tax=Streptomyces sp. NPDC058783 TaxID=3346633 RepID=UPI0036872EE2